MRYSGQWRRLVEIVDANLVRNRAFVGALVDWVLARRCAGTWNRLEAPACYRRLSKLTALTSRSGIRSTNFSWDRKMKKKECGTYHVYF